MMTVTSEEKVQQTEKPQQGDQFGLPWDISELMRSIFLDYFIGSLLLWKGKKENFESLACEPIYGFQGHGVPEHVVLDGQQRLTAMYYAFMAPNVPAPTITTSIGADDTRPAQLASR